MAIQSVLQREGRTTVVRQRPGVSLVSQFREQAEKEQQAMNEWKQRMAKAAKARSEANAQRAATAKEHQSQTRSSGSDAGRRSQSASRSSQPRADERSS